MFGSVVLDVAIGMVFVYLLLSLIATVLQEMLSSFMQLRSANLLRGMRSLFSGDSIWGVDLVDSIYTHGLVRGLFADPGKDFEADRRASLDAVQASPDGTAPQPQPIVNGQSRLPTFGERFTEFRLWLRRTIGIEAEKHIQGVSNQLLLPAYIPTRTFAMAMIDILNRNNVTGKEMMESITQSLAEHHWHYADNKAGQALYSLALDAQNDADAFQKNLENWYNDSMDRASGWYKRYTQKVLFYIGLILALTFNVSSIRVAQTFWFDRDARQAMATAADEYVKKHPDPDPAKMADKGTVASSESDLAKKLKESTDAFDTVTSSALLPVGWKYSVSQYWDSIWDTVHNYSSTRAWWRPVSDRISHGFAVFIGWLITALAISLGAPFWFDMLNKIMVVRGTIKPEEKSQPEPSKD